MGFWSRTSSRKRPEKQLPFTSSTAGGFHFWWRLKPRPRRRRRRRSRRAAASKASKAAAAARLTFIWPSSSSCRVDSRWLHTSAASEETILYLFFCRLENAWNSSHFWPLPSFIWSELHLDHRSRCKGTSEASLKNDELDGICFRIFSFVPSSRILGLLDGSWTSLRISHVYEEKIPKLIKEHFVPFFDMTWHYIIRCNRAEST